MTWLHCTCFDINVQKFQLFKKMEDRFIQTHTWLLVEDDFIEKPRNFIEIPLPSSSTSS